MASWGVGDLEGLWHVRWHDTPNKGDVLEGYLALSRTYTRTPHHLEIGGNAWQWDLTDPAPRLEGYLGPDFRRGYGASPVIDGDAISIAHGYYMLGLWGGKSQLRVVDRDRIEGAWTYGTDGGAEEWTRVASTIESVHLISKTDQTVAAGAVGTVNMAYDSSWWGPGNDMRGNRPSFTLELRGQHLWRAPRYYLDGDGAADLEPLGSYVIHEDGAKGPNGVVGISIQFIVWPAIAPGRKRLVVGDHAVEFDLVVAGFPTDDHVPSPPLVRIVTLTSDAGIGAAIVVEVEPDPDGPRDAEIAVALELGDSRLTVAARPGDVEEIYETAPIEIESADRDPSDDAWPVLRATAGGVTAERTLAGLTRDALLAHLQRVTARAIATDSPMEATLLAERVYDLATAAQAVDVLTFAAGLLGKAAGASQAPALLALLARDLAAQADAALDRGLARYLEGITHEVLDDPSLGAVEREALVLLREVAIARCLGRLSELARFKAGDGVIDPASFLALAPDAALARMRTLASGDVDAFTKLPGVVGSDQVRVQLAMQLHAAATAVGDRLEQVRYELQRAKDARAAYEHFKLIGGSEWTGQQVGRTRDEIARAAAEYDQLLAAQPLLPLTVTDENGKTAPLWELLRARPSVDLAVVALVDRAIAAAEDAARAQLLDLAGRRDRESLVELAGPTYAALHGYVRAMAGGLSQQLLDVAYGLYDAANADSAWPVVDRVLVVVQILGAPFPLLSASASVLIAMRSGTEAVLAYRDASTATTALDAGLGSTLAVSNARDNLHRRIDAALLDALFAGLDVALWQLARVARAAEIMSGVVKTATAAEVEAAGRAMRQTAEADTAIAVKIRDRARITTDHGVLADKARQRLTATQGELATARAADKVKKVERLAAKVGELTALVERHAQRLAGSQAKLAELMERAANPAKLDPLYFARQGSDVERAALGFWGKVADRYPGVVKQVAPNRFRVGPFEIRMKGRITDAAGTALVQPPEVHVPGDAEGVMITNPHAGKEMEFDRLIIDHERKVIYLEDLVRSADRRHIIKGAGYYAQLPSMFGDLLADGYRLMDPTRRIDIVWGEFKSPISALSPRLGSYTVVTGKSYHLD